jgi:hypothetical protein
MEHQRDERLNSICISFFVVRKRQFDTETDDINPDVCRTPRKSTLFTAMLNCA